MAQAVLHGVWRAVYRLLRGFSVADGSIRSELLLDGLHPTPEGHQIMARQLSAHLKKDNGN